MGSAAPPKKVGKNFINNWLTGLEILDRKKISINLRYPLKNFIKNPELSNAEKVGDIIYDFYSKEEYEKVIPTLNGYVISKDKSLKDNLVHDNDDIYLCNPFQIYISFDEHNNIPINVSLYQIFLDVFEKFYNHNCDKYYKIRLGTAYYNHKEIKPFDKICDIGIPEKGIINFNLGRDNNINCPYNIILEKIRKIEYRYFYAKKNCSIDDFKFELNNQPLDDIELNSIGSINFRNLKVLILNKCDIQNMEFLNLYSLSNLVEINLQKNKISYFNNMKLDRLEIFDLSYNNIQKYMVEKRIINIQDISSTVRIDIPLTLDFPKLKILNLSHNQIERIDLLKKLNSKELKELDLSHNHIKNIAALNAVPFGYLNKINLSHNKIDDLKVLDNLAFCNNIEDINLMDNEITNISILRDARLPNLKILNLLHNDISDFTVLQLFTFEKLEKLYIFPNQLDPDNYDKNSKLFINFKKNCQNIIEKKIEVIYKI